MIDYFRIAGVGAEKVVTGATDDSAAAGNCVVAALYFTASTSDAGDADCFDCQ